MRKLVSLALAVAMICPLAASAKKNDEGLVPHYQLEGAGMTSDNAKQVTVTIITKKKDKVTDSDLERVCRACGLDKFVRSLPQGFDTVLSESVSISAGQKQLMTIARAMLQNAPMLILDEATSSVDTRTELLIQRAMDDLTKDRTSFVIAHRLSTIKNADLILVMKDGDVIESGNHETLMKQNGFYAELYNSQFAN